ncbi:hypothetical protein [Rhizobium leguminosarum]|uniref:hypothetical protein n=1 Tax=Rhizobium leguminosarum TaxID=384 RepID=UPI003F9D2D72
MKGSPAAMSEEALITEIFAAEWPKAAKGKRRILKEAYKEMVPLAGLEPATPSLRNMRCFFPHHLPRFLIAQKHL